MAVKIYHNPKCSKSRETLQLLRDKGIEPEIIEYLNSPLSEDELIEILTMLGIGARDFIRRNEEIFNAKGLGHFRISEARLIQEMAENPVLIERPVVVSDGKAAIGRPPENVLTIL